MKKLILFVALLSAVACGSTDNEPQTSDCACACDECACTEGEACECTDCACDCSSGESSNHDRGDDEGGDDCGGGGCKPPPRELRSCP